MNELSKAFRNAMKKNIGSDWNFNCYGFNNYRFTDIKHVPKDDRGGIMDKYNLSDDDIIAYNPRVSHEYKPLTRAWIKEIRE